MDARYESELLGGGDTMLHCHLSDRATPSSVQEGEKVTTVNTAYAASYADDILLVQAVSPFTITLPVARSRRLSLVRISGSSVITIARSGADTINGSSSQVLPAAYTPLRLKAVAGVGYIEA